MRIHTDVLLATGRGLLRLLEEVGATLDDLRLVIETAIETGAGTVRGALKGTRIGQAIT